VSQSAVFEWLCERLEKAAGWNRLVARGTVRLVLKDMGLDPRTVGKKEMRIALRTALPPALEAHHVGDAQVLCEQIERELATATLPTVSADTPEAIFKRLGRTS
jgi:hypothetical protein